MKRGQAKKQNVVDIKRSVTCDVIGDVLSLFCGPFTSDEFDCELRHLCAIYRCEMPGTIKVGKRLAEIGFEVERCRRYSLPGDLRIAA